MLTLIDRQMIRSYFKAYFVCLLSLLSLYVVVDLFTNLDDFTHHTGGIGRTAQLIGIFYGLQLTQIFDRLCEAIVLMAAAFTVAWMQRNNEQLPLLSAGVSTRRIVLPVILSAGFMLGLSVFNQEFLMPWAGIRLTFQRDDPEGEKEFQVRGTYEPNLIHLEGASATRQGRIVKKLRVTIPLELAGRLIHITADEARYVPPGPGPRTGGWEMTGAVPPDLTTWDPRIFERIDNGKYFLKVENANFDILTRHDKAFQLASTYQLFQDLQSPEAARCGPGSVDRKKAVLFHMRLTRPLLGLLLVVLGLSVILKDQNRNLYISAGLCMALCGLFFAVSFLCKLLGDNNLLTPALAAWIPIMLFGPIAIVKFESVHT